ncbi:HD domain-containing protein [Flavobacterium hauense]
MIDIEKVKEFILEKQKREFPEGLYYHNVSHVLDVYETVIKHIEVAKIENSDALLLKTAALFHDSGFIVKSQGHEEVSCDFARQYLPEFGYSQGQIHSVCGMIMATKIPQTPCNHLEEIIADADLDYLGRDDFFEISNKLFRELKTAGIVDAEEQWNAIQVDFFAAHHYFTKEAKDWRQAKKEEHLKIIKSKLTNHN